LTILTLTKVDVGMLEDVGTSANNIIQLDSNGKIPAVDGSLLTGTDTALSASSDPTISTNPTNGVGTKYRNTTSGEMFVCTDATAGANVWINVGVGRSNIANAPYTRGGTQYAFFAGGLKHNPVNSNANTIERMAYASSSNCTDVGNLSAYIRYSMSPASSTTHGYTMGGDRHTVGNSNSGASPSSNIEKFQFAASSNSTSIGNLTGIKSSNGRGNLSSATFGYCSGGSWSGGRTNKIEKTSFSTDTNATHVGDLIRVISAVSHQSAELYGYSSGGWDGFNSRNEITKFNFSTDGNATDVGDLVAPNDSGGGASGPDYGYVAGAAATNVIQKFAYASDANATDVGDLYSANGTPTNAIDTGGAHCSSSTTHAYRAGAGGGNPIPTGIDRWSFSTDGNATDVGDMIQDGSGGGRTDGAAFQD